MHQITRYIKREHPWNYSDVSLRLQTYIKDWSTCNGFFNYAVPIAQSHHIIFLSSVFIAQLLNDTPHSLDGHYIERIGKVPAFAFHLCIGKSAYTIWCLLENINSRVKTMQYCVAQLFFVCWREAAAACTKSLLACCLRTAPAEVRTECHISVYTLHNTAFVGMRRRKSNNMLKYISMYVYMMHMCIFRKHKPHSGLRDWEHAKRIDRWTACIFIECTFGMER